MKLGISLMIGFLLINSPITAVTDFEGYEIVSLNNKENITLYAKKIDSLYRGFKIDFKGGVYTRPFWNSETNPTYAPQIFYKDINNDKREELVITLTKGHGTGLLWEDVYVFNTLDNRLIEEIVDHPLAILKKNVKTKLNKDKAEIIVNNKKWAIDLSPFEIKPDNLFDDIGFGSIVDYEVINNCLMVRLSGQVSPGMFVGDVIITYEYRQNMYQAKTIDFIPHHSIEKNPFYGPVN
ncbi:hypothetical protein IMZ08_13795 [Bacillus luteolus]|uniref:Uncharacterized protein n=1 Tax=Litchfieldia luteola TaxID=682179 RepID=A0ABR9QL47_9BACI|nr:hypothetical protein [Cytobacillus luteolus]MBE4909136.1 hypothetical protein [Cytobacillus luteolus]MBP1940413.1 hypothetical protein [Cytobacillus luteolus]